MSNEYKNKDIIENTKVCGICYEKLKKISEDIFKEAGESTPTESTSSNQTPESQIMLPADFQTSICSLELYEEANELLTRNKFSLSSFKFPSSVDATSLRNYVHRKRKQLLDTFYEETDCKIRKLYEVSRHKLEFNECKICDEWNENLSLVLENENLTFIQKVR